MDKKQIGDVFKKLNIESDEKRKKLIDSLSFAINKNENKIMKFVFKSNTKK